MKNPNTPINKVKANLLTRWSAEDYPGAEPRFQLSLFGKDIAIFVLLPILAVIMFKACENAASTSNKPKKKRERVETDRNSPSRSQIINFNRAIPQPRYAGVSKKAPGTLVRVRLLNVVETYSNAPVHAQIIDASLGRTLMGGTLIGDAVSDSNYERINITFRFARDPRKSGLAIPISARALGLDGTLGIEATKKAGFVTRSTLGSASSAAQDLKGGEGSTDFKDVLIKALTAGLIQEFGSSTKVEQNRAQVLTLRPPTEFFVELTDFFPGGSQ